MVSTSKKSTVPLEQWHVCEHCLDPIIRDFGEMVHRGRWNASPQVHYDNFEQILNNHKFEFGLTWLKVFTSMEFAAEVQRTIMQPLKALANMQREAQHKHTADKPDWGRSSDWILFAIEREVEDARAADRDWWDDTTFLVRYDELYGAMLTALWRLGMASSVLRLKLKEPAGDPAEEPVMLTLKQIAAQCGREKRWMEDFTDDIGRPDIQSRGRRPAKWASNNTLVVEFLQRHGQTSHVQ